MVRKGIATILVICCDAFFTGCVAAVLVAALGGGGMPVDKEQKMRACIVTRPTGKQGGYIVVRVTFQRIVWNTTALVTKSESIIDPAIYQEFFGKQSKAIFLESQEI